MKNQKEIKQIIDRDISRDHNRKLRPIKNNLKIESPNESNTHLEDDEKRFFRRLLASEWKFGLIMVFV